MPPGTVFRPFLRATHRANVMGTTQVAVAAAVAGIGAYAWYTRSNSTSSDKPVFSSFGFHTLRLDSTELINHNTKKLRFALPDATKPSGLPLTSALLTVAFPSGRWLPVIRPYTPVNDINEPGYVELMVKLYPNGKQSTHLHSLQPGDTLTMAPVRGLAWTANQHPHVALIAGGAGISPMYQLARGILRDPTDRTRVTLVWGVNTDADLFLRDEFAALEREHPGRFRAVYVVADPGVGSQHKKGFVTRQLLEGVGLAAGEEQNRDGKVLVCGPPAMEKALKGKKTGVLAELGYRPDQVYSF
ncbi:uncharacterized protein B0H64DRAFT_445117 [Chaetomium fimeti]|uniref:NADH-cytochrome b5 reductase 2 n=1 Tax=Chaetomium fimeti TaxID=1854472 RepID=A0AAE0LNN7_9PEZI|nr:hypothetical protein B0H64DRAFT_445117 [Chaetomium fimeti]